MVKLLDPVSCLVKVFIPILWIEMLTDRTLETFIPILCIEMLTDITLETFLTELKALTRYLQLCTDVHNEDLHTKFCFL